MPAYEPDGGYTLVLRPLGAEDAEPEPGEAKEPGTRVANVDSEPVDIHYTYR
jgi:hypothetical protein